MAIDTTGAELHRQIRTLRRDNAALQTHNADLAIELAVARAWQVVTIDRDAADFDKQQEHLDRVDELLAKGVAAWRSF